VKSNKEICIFHVLRNNNIALLNTGLEEITLNSI